MNNQKIIDYELINKRMDEIHTIYNKRLYDIEKIIKPDEENDDNEKNNTSNETNDNEENKINTSNEENDDEENKIKPGQLKKII